MLQPEQREVSWQVNMRHVLRTMMAATTTAITATAILCQSIVYISNRVMWYPAQASSHAMALL